MKIYEKRRMEILIYGLILVVASLPVACGYIMQGGDILLWLSRIEEIANSEGICLFPSPEVMLPYTNRTSAVHSNLLLYIPALLRKIGLSITSAYRIYMLVIQTVIVLSARAFFKSIFEEDILAVYVGVILFITCPYRIYICYDAANLGAAAGWALTILYGWAIVMVCKESHNWKRYAVAVFVLSGIAYTDMILFVTVSAISVLCYSIRKKWFGFGCMAVSCMLSAPALIYFLRYLVKGNLEQYNLPLDSISARGYTLGQLLSTFAYRDNLPGIGIALFGAIAVMVWLIFVGDISFKSKEWKYTIAVALLMFFAATVHFPWDFAQRVTAIFHRFVSLIGTPNVFMGFACFLISIPATYSIGRLPKQNSKFVRYGITILILSLAIGSAIWHCNTLTYTRPPK